MDKSKLIDRILELEAAVENLKSVTRLDRAAAIAAVLGLTGLEARFVSILSTGRVMNVDQILDAAYFDRPGDRPNGSVFRARLGRIRGKLFPYGVSIETRHGVGFQMLNSGLLDAAIHAQSPAGLIRSAELPVIVTRGKTALALQFLYGRRDRYGRAAASTREIKEAINLAGPVQPVMDRLQRDQALKIVARPTDSSPRQKWIVAIPEIANV